VSEVLWNDLTRRFAPDSPIVADVAAALRPLDPMEAFFIRPETVFDQDSVFDAVAVYVLTARHLVIVATDVTYELSPAGDFVTTTQVVPLTHIRDYQIVRRRVLDGPEKGTLAAISLRLRWGGGWNVDVRPAACDDPTCEADHGYVAMGQTDDGELLLDSSLSAEAFAEGLAFIDQLLTAVNRL
jgi:hypothetical protein